MQIQVIYVLLCITSQCVCPLASVCIADSLKKWNVEVIQSRLSFQLRGIAYTGTNCYVIQCYYYWLNWQPKFQKWDPNCIKPGFQFKWLCFSSSKEWANAPEYCMNWWLQYCFSSYCSFSIVYLVSKARAAQEGACIFLPLFPVFPYQSKKVVATPTRKIEIEVYACWQSAEAKKRRTVCPQT